MGLNDSAPKEKLISVIIPVYNTEKYLSRCLDSIINNTYKNLEIICVDDGSTDNSFEILKKYARIDDRIIAVQQENGGGIFCTKSWPRGFNE